MLVIIEDMHWTDVASQKLLIASIRKAENKSIMIVVSYRTGEVEIPEYDEHYVSEFSMKRLSAQKSETLFDSINIGVPLSVIQKQDVLEKCEGVPLFLEELTLNAIRNSSHENGRVYLETPSTLFDLFIQRYDSFEPQVKAVAQLAAVIGQEFKPKIIEAILGLRQQQCAHIIDILVDKDQIYKTDQNSNWYQFKHALIRGAIYDNTLYQDKYRLHKAVYDQLNSGDRIRSAIMMRCIPHHHKMLMFYATFKKAN